ncbi:unnamed protein product [Mycena citricolor]|uniref:DUF7330 domain-containing protein n=1 Tax=Mycena citricolor TaxID=2018698 RepID=A0AAD2JYM0_9AGAR|nr:unnamed protein product [Mycena citricolor]
MELDTKTPLLAVPADARQDAVLRRSRERGGFVKAVAVAALFFWLGLRYREFVTDGVSRALVAVHDEPEPAAPWPIPEEYTADCVDWTGIGASPAGDELPLSAEAGLELPVSAESLFVLSRAVEHHELFASGHVKFVQSGNADAIKVDATAYFYHEEYLAHSKMCLLTSGQGESGVGLFTNWASKPDHRRHRHARVRLDVTLTVPAVQGLPLERLWTDLTAFEQKFGDLSAIAFDSLYIKGAVGAISAEALQANVAHVTTNVGSIELARLSATSANVTTSAGQVTGLFSASESLGLVTSTGSIVAQIELSDDAADGPAQLVLHTSAGSIDSTVTLSSTKADAAFNVTAETSTGKLTLAVPSAPLDSTITIDARNGFGAARVSLPPTFEGSLRAKTSFGSTSVNVAEKVEDPSGQGRKRQVSISTKRSSVEGSVGWSTEGLSRGSVNVETNVAGVTLDI